MHIPRINFRTVFKFAITQAVALKSEDAIRYTIADHTSIDEDNFALRLGAAAGGGACAGASSPYTDNAVDKIADKIAVLKQTRKDRKITTE